MRRCWRLSVASRGESVGRGKARHEIGAGRLSGRRRNGEEAHLEGLPRYRHHVISPSPRESILEQIAFGMLTLSGAETREGMSGGERSNIGSHENWRPGDRPGNFG